MSSNIAMPPGVDPRMFAFLQAQRQLQQQGQQQGQPPQHLQAPPPGSMVHQQPQPQQRPGGDADVASFLLQLKTNQNGEPVTEAEALRMAEQHHQAALNAAAARQQMPPQPQATAGLPYGHPGVIPGMYAYPGMVPFAPPPPQGNQFAAAAAAAAMGGMAPAPVGVPPVGYPAMHPVVAAAHQGVSQVAPIPGGVPGMNHSTQQQLAPGMQGGAPTDSGPVMTDAYIEHLITNDVVASNSKNSSNGSEGTENKDTSSASGGSESPTNGSISAKDDMNIALVVPKDRDLIPDALFVALGQMKACRLQQSDRVGCYKTRTLGFMGMCCKVSKNSSIVFVMDFISIDYVVLVLVRLVSSAASIGSQT